MPTTAIADRVAARELVGIKDGEQLRLPAWQFTARGARPGLREVIAAWPGTPLSLSMFAVRPAADFNGRTPAQELTRAGGVRRVRHLLSAMSAARW